MSIGLMVDKSKFTEHKITVIQGALGDMAIEQLGWWDEKQQLEFWEKHNTHVEKLKAKGEYLKPVEMTMWLEHNPMYDAVKKINK